MSYDQNLYPGGIMYDQNPDPAHPPAPPLGLTLIDA